MKRYIYILLIAYSFLLSNEGDITTFKLENGLQTIIMEKHSIPVVAVQVWYDVGSHDEWSGVRGVAHLFEHMMFRGSENYGSEEHARLINEVGGNNNAFTSDDVTVYHERLPAGELELALKLEAERMHLLKLDQDILNTEREVVHEEYRQRTDNPIAKLFLKFRRSLYPKNHPYSETPIGIMEQLDTLSVNTCQTFYDRYYAPNNASLIIVGDVQVDEARKLVETYFGPVRISENFPPNPDLTIPDQTEKIVTHEKSSFDLPVTLMGYHVPSVRNPDSVPLAVLSYIISNGESSRLHKTIVRDKEMALFAGGFPFTMMGPGIFMYFAVYFPQVKDATIETEILNIIEDIKVNGVTEKELQKARKQMMAEKVFEKYSANSLANSLGNAEVVLGNYNLYNEEIERFNAVTAEDVNRVANTYFNEDNLTIMHIAPENLGFFKRLMFRIASLFM